MTHPEGDPQPWDEAQVAADPAVAVLPRRRAWARSADEVTAERLFNNNRSLPFSDEAEKGVLSCLLQEPVERIPETRQHLPAEAFYHIANRTVYQTLCDFADAGLPIDIATLTHSLRERGLLDKVGGPAAISELYTFIPVPAHYPFYQQTVQQKWRARQLIAWAATVQESAFNHGSEFIDEDIMPLLSQAEDGAFALLSAAMDQSAGGTKCQVIDAQEMALQWTDAFEAIKAIPAGSIPGARTGFYDLDRMYGGLAPDEDGDFELVAAYPGMGKTVDFVTALEDLAINQGIPCLAFPLEMGRLGISHRLHLGRARVNVSHSRNSFPIAKGDVPAIGTATMQIATAPIFWDWHSFIEIADLRASAQICLRKHGRKDKFPRMAVLIDHFGQILPSSKEGKRDKLLGQVEVLRGLHELRKMGILVKLYAQLDKASREGQAAGHSPTNAALKGASELVEYPTHIRFLHRPAAPDVAPWSGKFMRAVKSQPASRKSKNFHETDAEEATDQSEVHGDKQKLWESITASYRHEFPEAWCDPRRIPASKTVAQVDYEEHAKTVITKNRHGPTGEICLRFLPEYQRFVGRTLHLYSGNKAFRQVELPGF